MTPRLPRPGPRPGPPPSSREGPAGSCRGRESRACRSCGGPARPRRRRAPLCGAAPPAGLEADDPEGPGPDDSFLPGRTDDADSLRQNRRGSVGEDGWKEGDGLLEVDEELGRRDDVEALEVGRRAFDDPPGAAYGR